MPNSLPKFKLDFDRKTKATTAKDMKDMKVIQNVDGRTNVLEQVTSSKIFSTVILYTGVRFEVAALKT